MSFEQDTFLQEIYDEWMDVVNEHMPLRPTVFSLEVENALRVNQQIVSNMHSIRRHLELDDLDPVTRVIRPIQANRDELNVRSGSNVISDVFQDIIDLLLTNEVTPRGDFEDVKVVLTTEEFDALEKLEVHKGNMVEYANKDCNVCIETYKEGDKLIRLHCQHTFHEECIKNWLCNENVKCPVCRSDTRKENTMTTQK